MEGLPEALIDTDAIQANVAALCKRVGEPQVMAVVKSEGYGHGLVETATASLAGGATWLGVAQIADAVALRRAGITVPVLNLVGSPHASHGDAIRHDVDATAGTAALVRQITLAAEREGKPARLHLEADTGMSRGGATADDWAALVHAALAAEAAGFVRVVGLWSHFACADIPGHPSIDAQLTAFRAAVAFAIRAGARPEVRHMANTAATLTLPHSHFDMVRSGGAVVGLSTLPGGAPDWLRPAMTLRARLIHVKQVGPETGVSYGHRYITDRDMMLGLVPLGYNEGIPRQATNTGWALIRGRRCKIAGTVSMNLMILELGDSPAEVGDEVVVFGPGDRGEPTVQDWADLLGTLPYEIVTRLKVQRVHCGVAAAKADLEVANMALPGLGGCRRIESGRK